MTAIKDEIFSKGVGSKIISFIFKENNMQPLASTQFKSPAWFYIILVLLAGIAGSIDVISYFQFHTFTANMTGNTILLGISIGEGKLQSSMHSLTALLAFTAGAFLSAFIVEKKDGWSSYITRSIVVEAIFTATFSVLTFYHVEALGNSFLYISIILSAVAMGMQSAAIRHLKIPGVVTTFITGTITSIGMSAVTGLHKGFKERNGSSPVTKNLEQQVSLQIIIYFAYALTAVVCGWMEYHHAAILPLLPLLLTVGVLLIAMRALH